MICYETITVPILQCVNGLHFCCLDCITKYEKSCLQCRSGKVFHNKFLEKLVKKQMVKCSHDGCPKYLFKWAKDEHEPECAYIETECEYCNLSISMKSIAEHVKSKCNLEWLEHTHEHQGGTLELAGFCSRIIRGYSFDMENISKSFCVIYFDYCVFFKRCETSWKVRLLNYRLKQSPLEIRYCRPGKSSKVKKQSILKLLPDCTLKDVNVIELPIDCIDGPQPSGTSINGLLLNVK